MTGDVVTILLPTLTQAWREDFNVLNVMHHGTHEKQISNIFTWLLDARGSHGLGDRFQRIFIAAVSAKSGMSVPMETFAVEQERNAAEDGKPKDIPDIVLSADHAVIVIENYHKSDGHHHSYETYEAYARRRGGEGSLPVVVMLCGRMDDGAWAEERNLAWRQASVVTYPELLAALAAELADDVEYQLSNPKPWWFIDQLVSYFVKGTPVNQDLISFVAAMCTVGEAERFRHGNAAEVKNFGDTFSQLAMERFTESRDVLMKVKGKLKAYAAGTLLPQLEAATQARQFGEVAINYSGIYQWTVNILPVGQHPLVPDEGGNEAEIAGVKDGGRGLLQIKFGPSAWFARETPEGRRYFPKHEPTGEADFEHLFLTWNGEIRQSSVTMMDVLSGVPDHNTQLRDDALALIQQRTPPGAIRQDQETLIRTNGER